MHKTKYRGIAILGRSSIDSIGYKSVSNAISTANSTLVNGSI